MNGFVDIKELSEINGGSSLISSTTDPNTIITIKYGIITPTVKYGVRPLYGIYPVDLK